MKLAEEILMGFTIVALMALFVVGITAGFLADAFGRVDEKCRDWFEEIYDGPGN